MFLLSSYFFSAMNVFLVRFLMPLVVLDATSSPLWTAITYGVGMLPFLIVAPIAGVVGDLYNKKRLLEIFLFLGVLSLIAIILIPFRSRFVPLILVVYFVLTSIDATNHPIFQGWLPEIVPRAKLKGTNASVNGIDNFCQFFVPFAAGLLLIVLAKRQILMINILLPVLALACLALIPYKYSAPSKTEENGFWKLFREGFVYIAQNKPILYMTILFVGNNFGQALFYSNYVFTLKSLFHFSESFVGYALALAAAFALLGSFVASFITKRFNLIKIILTINIIMGALFVLLAIFPLKWITVVIWGIMAASDSIIVVAFFSFRQEAVQPGMLTRVVAFGRAIAFTPIPIAALVGGVLMEQTHSLSLISSISALSILGFAVPIGVLFSRLNKRSL